jgi:hypothetical protein
VTWLQFLNARRQTADQSPELSRRLLRHLFAPRWVGIGSRVLSVGRIDSQLADFLEFLGLQVDCVGRCSELTGGDQANAYDLVIARDVPEFQGDLVGSEALRATGRLFAAARPQGRIALITRMSARSWVDFPGGHLRSCYARHLAAFPGTCQVCYFPDGFVHRATWNWLAGRQPRSGFLAAIHQLPAEPVTSSLLRGVGLANHHAAEPCCSWVRRQTETITLRRAA